MSSIRNDLVVAGLNKAFGSHSVLRDLNLEVPAGNVVAVLGPSGSGKTTLLRVLAGFDRPDAGTVKIGGKTVESEHAHVPPEKRRIGYVSQEGSLFPHLNVEANVAFGLSRSERRGDSVRELLAMVGMADLARRYPHQLSGGQQQRVALARALAVKPTVVLLDEPFASLDANTRASVRNDVREILRAGSTTTLLVTHDQDEALSIADLVAVIRDGTIAQMDQPEDLYSHPRDPELARFVGEVNLFDGVVDAGMLAGANYARVVTPFGIVSIDDGARTSPGGRVAVMVRPEQVRVHPGPDGPGVRGRITNIEFYGHDAVVTVDPEPAEIRTTVVARVLGGLALEPGSLVTVSIEKAVGAWPAERTEGLSEN